MKRLWLAMAVLGGCVGGGQHEPVLSDQLVACTDSDDVVVGTDYDDLPPGDSRRETARWIQDRRAVSQDPEVVAAALASATKWALRECYLPCPHFQMCGEVRKLDEARASVYLRPDGIYNDIREGHFVIAPEAQVLVDLHSGAVADSLLYHSGCAWSDPRCERFGDEAHE